MNSTRPSDVRLRVPERAQVAMTMQCKDDLVDADHLVRTIWAAVCVMDLSAHYTSIKARTGQFGRDATDPRLMVSVWLFGHTQGVGSARELARLCVESRPYQWLCGGVTLNHHTLSDFRVGNGAALDDLFTRSLASLVEQGLVTVERISQDGTRVRACCGASSLRRKERLGELLVQAKQHVAELKTLLNDPAQSGAMALQKKKAMERAARERQDRIEQAIKQMPELEAAQQKRAKKVSNKDKAAGKIKAPRASTTDAQARVMKMPSGGFRPAVNVQLAVDTFSRAIVGVDVIGAGVDTGQLQSMRKQVERRTGGTVKEHLADGGYLTFDDVDAAAEAGVTLYVPPKPPRDPEKYGTEFEPRKGDSEAVKAWRQQMGTDAAKEIYKQRASTVETVNADLKRRRGLVQMTVRGLEKAKCIALWSALAYNLMHFGAHLIG